jgi:hypothetical protein
MQYLLHYGDTPPRTPVIVDNYPCHSKVAVHDDAERDGKLMLLVVNGDL